MTALTLQIWIINEKLKEHLVTTKYLIMCYFLFYFFDYIFFYFVPFSQESSVKYMSHFEVLAVFSNVVTQYLVIHDEFLINGFKSSSAGYIAQVPAKYS